MFREWGFLLTEIWGLLALAALIGLFAGWLIWAGRVAVQTAPPVVSAAKPDGGSERLGAELAACNARNSDLAARLDEAERALTAARMRAEDAEALLVAARGAAKAPASGAGPAAMPAPPEAMPPQTRPAVRPQALVAARAGKPDDLQQIKGIGPKLEALCHRLGFYHFDQIAKWTAEEIAWVDDNLEGFKGRVTRDNWVEQARALDQGKART